MAMTTVINTTTNNNTAVHFLLIRPIFELLQVRLGVYKMNF